MGHFGLDFKISCIVFVPYIFAEYLMKLGRESVHLKVFGRIKRQLVLKLKQERQFFKITLIMVSRFQKPALCSSNSPKIKQSKIGQKTRYFLWFKRTQVREFKLHQLLRCQVCQELQSTQEQLLNKFS